MAPVHYDKSILTFHFKEILEDGRVGHPLTLLGLSAILFGPTILPDLARATKPVAKTLVKATLAPTPSGLRLSDWVSALAKQAGEALPAPTCPYPRHERVSGECPRLERPPQRSSAA